MGAHERLIRTNLPVALRTRVPDWFQTLPPIEGRPYSMERKGRLVRLLVTSNRELAVAADEERAGPPAH